MDSSTSILVFLALFSLWCFFYWRPRRQLWAAAQKIPGPRPLPLIGNVLMFLGETSKSFPKMLKMREGYGNIARVWLGTKLFVVIADPEDIKCIYVNPRITNRDPNLALAIEPVFGNSLFTSADDAFQVRRKLLTPLFHLKKIECYEEIFGAKAKILVEELEEMADGTPIDVNKKLCLCAVDTVWETIVGVTSNTQKDGYSDLQDKLYTVIRLIMLRVLYPWQLIPWIYPITIDGWKAKAAIKTLDAYFSDPIARKLAAYRQGDRSAGIKTGSGKTVTSFLDMLIEASETQGPVMSEKEILDEVKIMAAAALLTISNTIFVLLLLIAIHPEWQDALFAEMADVFADDMTRPATSEDFLKMPVLDRVIRETLRMFPVGGVLPREITEDIDLPSGYVLPAGCSSVVMTYFVHRDPNNFPEPDKFLPDRWLPGSGRNEHAYAYIPFGAGPRRCMGQKYSLVQIKSTVSHLVRRFKMATYLTMEDLEKVEMEPILRIRSGNMQLEKRIGVAM